MRRLLPAVSRAAGALRGLPACIISVARVVGAGLIVSACAQSQASNENRSQMGVPPSQRVALSVPQQVELEADGLAVQAPPRVQQRPEPDDPSEPFSPNYGPPPEPAEAPPAPPPPVRQASREPVILRSRTTPMSPAEVRAIIAQAMVAHEKFYP
ncbi:MAG: hypothetical protein KKB37_11945 [Alphaproteobacteria bacterium]|nr:hypothetical protein [Alphaproteobacteria bacterium]